MIVTKFFWCVIVLLVFVLPDDIKITATSGTVFALDPVRTPMD